MTNQIKCRIALVLFTVLTAFSSCLKKDLPAYPLWNGTIINNVYVEYRYNSNQLMYGDSVVAYQKLIVAQVIDSTNNIITVTLTIPAANGTFTADQRARINLTHLWMYFDLSTSASIAATGSTPKPGDVGDLSKSLTYQVTAADGTKRLWTINVAPIPVINKYEGSYTSNGYFYHPSNPRAITALAKSVLTSDPNSVTVDLGDLGANGYSAIFTVDPSTNNVSIVAAPSAGGAPYTMFTNGLPTTNPGYTAQWAGSASCNNTYDPVTKTFYVRYGYLGATGWRVTEEAIKMN